MTHLSTHLSMEALLALRERRAASEPGGAAAWEHLQACSDCRNELEHLHQRTAQLKALTTLRPARDAWPTIVARVRADRWRRRTIQGAGLVGLAMAASLAITVVTNRPATPVKATVAQVESIHKAQARSRELEQKLNSHELNAQVLDGQTAGLVQEAEDRLAKVDQAIEDAEKAQQQGQTQQVLQLWQERNDLLDMIVNAHASPATHVEF